MWVEKERDMGKEKDVVRGEGKESSRSIDERRKREREVDR